MYDCESTPENSHGKAKVLFAYEECDATKES